MEDGSLNLCAVCANIDFGEYFRSETHVRRHDGYWVRPSEDAVRLGYLEEVFERSIYCSFCRLTIKALCRRWERSMWQTPQELVDQSKKDGEMMECYIYSYLYAENKGYDGASSVSLPKTKNSQQVYRIGIATCPPTDPPSNTHVKQAGDIQLSASSVSCLGKGSLFHGRALDSGRANIRLAREWLDLCKSEHGEICECPAIELKDAISPASPKDLLVIDVRRMCLFQMPEGSRYLALSYRWPTRDVFKTTEATLPELLIAGSLEAKVVALPQTIRDAICCVEELGEAYLWVDALCIIQDSEEHKRIQIRQMDRIYGSALLTIICAPADARDNSDVNDGLPCYRSRVLNCEQGLERVQGLDLLIPFIGVNMMVDDSRWCTRAWTYQEDRLSRRKLFFTDVQLYYQCSCSVFCEDTIGEGNSKLASIYPFSSLWNSNGIHAPQWENQSWELSWISRAPIRNPVEGWEVYSRHLDQYSSREMSDPRDIILAFEGILSQFRHVMRTKFWYGLPEIYFDEALLWLEAGPHVRREDSIPCVTELVTLLD
jgi:Heterokaryon incompatibility protein (HET)